MDQNWKDNFSATLVEIHLDDDDEDDFEKLMNEPGYQDLTEGSSNMAPPSKNPPSGQNQGTTGGRNIPVVEIRKHHWKIPTWTVFPCLFFLYVAVVMAIASNEITTERTQPLINESSTPVPPIQDTKEDEELPLQSGVGETSITGKITDASLIIAAREFSPVKLAKEMRLGTNIELAIRTLGTNIELGIRTSERLALYMLLTVVFMWTATLMCMWLVSHDWVNGKYYNDKATNSST